MDADQWVKEVERIAESNICDFLITDEKGHITVDREKLFSQDARVIKSFSIHRYANGSEQFKIHFHDKHQAYRLLRDYLGLDEQEQTNA